MAERRNAWAHSRCVARQRQLQARIDAALAHLAKYDTSAGWQATHEIVEQARAALQGVEPWSCARCGSDRWVGWRAGPEHEGWQRKAQCLPCGNVQALPATEEAPGG